MSPESQAIAQAMHETGFALLVVFGFLMVGAALIAVLILTGLPEKAARKRQGTWK